MREIASHPVAELRGIADKPLLWPTDEWDRPALRAAWRARWYRMTGEILPLPSQTRPRPTAPVATTHESRAEAGGPSPEKEIEMKPTDLVQAAWAVLIGGVVTFWIVVGAGLCLMVQG